MLKRIFDLSLVILAAPVWLPLLALLMVAVWLKMGRPIFFRQRRPGLNGRVFEIIKFRTMLPSNGPDGLPMPDAVRLPPFGRWLRALSLDEFPELLNVLAGEMSLVGPRPLLVEYLERYTPEQARRHEVKPGITGLAQVMGRNSLSWEEKFRWDLHYVDHQSLRLDLRILFLTFVKVVKRDGISAQGEATMPEFLPSRERRKVLRN